MVQESSVLIHSQPSRSYDGIHKLGGQDRNLLCLNGVQPMLTQH